jgi:uncharacterized protein (TIGR02246 family)
MIRQIAIMAVAALPMAAWDGVAAQTVADELRAAEDRWEELWAAKDAQGLAALYTEDAMRLPPDATRTVGRDAIEAMFEDEFAAGLENLQLEATDIDHDGNVGWVVGNSTIEFPTGDTMGTGTGNYVVVYRKEADGVWRIVIDTWNDAP